MTTKTIRDFGGSPDRYGILMPEQDGYQVVSYTCQSEPGTAPFARNVQAGQPEPETVCGLPSFVKVGMRLNTKTKVFEFPDGSWEARNAIAPGADAIRRKVVA